jgi:hypothetical protein
MRLKDIRLFAHRQANVEQSDLVSRLFGVRAVIVTYAGMMQNEQYGATGGNLGGNDALHRKRVRAGSISGRLR